MGETHTRSLVQQTGKQKAQQHLPVALAGDLHDGQGVVGAVASLVKLDVTRQALQTHLQPEKHTSHTSHTLHLSHRECDKNVCVHAQACE